MTTLPTPQVVQKVMDGFIRKHVGYPNRSINSLSFLTFSKDPLRQLKSHGAYYGVNVLGFNHRGIKC